MTWAVLNATSLGEMKVRIEGLSSENMLLHEELRTAQGRYDAAQTSREDTISKRAGEHSSFNHNHKLKPGNSSLTN